MQQNRQQRDKSGEREVVLRNYPGRKTTSRERMQSRDQMDRMVEELIKRGSGDNSMERIFKMH